MRESGGASKVSSAKPRGLKVRRVTLKDLSAGKRAGQVKGGAHSGVLCPIDTDFCDPNDPGVQPSGRGC